MDLNKLTLFELKSLKNDVEKAIKKAEKKELDAVRKTLEKTARQLGFTLEEVIASQPQTKKVLPKYINPTNPNQKWSGRGRKPVWVLEALDQGKTLTDLEI